MTRRSGLDVLLEDPSRLLGRRVGLLANAASVTSDLVPARRALLAAGVDVRMVFGPEHGFWGAAQDMEAVASPCDCIVSLYGDTFEDLSPRPEQLDGLDVIVSDLPDVGSRYYTFVWTNALMMKACAPRGIPVVLLDRENPLGRTVEGNLPEERLLSFVGLHPLPIRHGLTPGELAGWVNGTLAVGCDLEVVKMKGDGARARPDSWVLPSPNMPTRDTALVYPGGCLVEGTNLSEGRGTTRPFELVGAPWLDAETAAEAANALGLPGVVFRPQVFKPGFQKHAGRPCGGVQLHVRDASAFRPYETGLRLIKCLHDLDPASFAWRTERYEYRDDVPAIDLLTGTPLYRELVTDGRSLDEWIATFRADEERFRLEREPFLLYGTSPAILHLVGAHDAGKTTLAVRLIESLTARGLRVASIKHTDHEYETDTPGKDSQRHAAAGATPALLVAGTRVARHEKAGAGPSLDSLVAGLSGADVVLVEGFRRQAGPKIEVFRAATGRGPVAKDDPQVFAVFGDRSEGHPSSVPHFGVEAFDRLLDLATERLGL